MNVRAHAPHLPGCDDCCAIIADRWETINDFLVTHLHADSEWQDTLSPSTHQILQQQFIQLEENVTQLRSPHMVERSRGRRQWQANYLLPVAQQFDLVEKAWNDTLYRCWVRGLFDCVAPGKSVPNRPTLGYVLAKIRVILKASDTSKRQVAILVEEGVCRDEASAREVVKKLSLVEEQAASGARGIIIAAIRFGLVGLLCYSEYPCAEELCMLQRHAEHIVQFSENPQKTLATLRADIIALFHILRSTEPPLKLWKQNLMYEPQGSALRERYRQSISPRLHNQIITALSTRRGCSESEAATLLDAFVNSGVAGLIGWRCANDKDTLPRVLTIQRIENAVELHLGALALEGRKEIVRLLSHLYDAFVETGIPLSIVPLLNKHPSSSYRIRLGRRLSFGYPAMLRYRRRPYRPGQRRMARRRWSNRVSHQSDIASLEDPLIAAFTQRAGLSTKNNNKEGRTRLRYLLTYGGIGILPKADWLKHIDSRLISFLYFLKLGKPDGTLDSSSMFQRLRDYGTILGIAAPSLQLTRVIFNSLPKPPHWHGGLGEAVALVRQRATLILNAPRLHEAWIVLPLKPRLRLRLVDDSGCLISDYCSVVVVFDKASQRPVGCWTGTEITDIGLALYQSIWHPGTLYWPLRGIPDLIQVPQSLVAGRGTDLERAAKWILAKVELLSASEKSRLLNTMPYTADLLSRMSVDLPRYLQQKFGTKTVTVQQSLEAVLAWLVSEEKQMGAGNCFPAHRSSLIPSQCSDYGMLMPAYDSPTAGWLLPVVDHVTSGRDKIVYRGVTYMAKDFKVEPGTKLNVRAFPYRYERMSMHVFVETESETINYLIAHL